MNQKILNESPVRVRLLIDGILIASVAILYFLAAWLGLRVALVAEQVTAIWAPTGIALAALRLFGWRAWPGITLGALAVNLTAHETVAVACGIACGNTLEAVAGAWLLERLIHFDNALERFKDAVGLLILAAGLSTAISATIGTLCLCLGGIQPWSRFGPVWGVWWLGDATGDLIVAPFILVWATTWRGLWPPRRMGEGLALLIVLAGVAWRVFAKAGPETETLHAYAFFPVLIWGAVRFRQRGATAIALLISVVALICTLHGYGPFERNSANESLNLQQTYMAIVSSTGLLLAAAISERRQAQQLLRESDERLRFTLDAAHVGTWEWNLLSRQGNWSENMEAVHGLPEGAFGSTFEGFLEHVHLDDRDAARQAVRKAVSKGGQYFIEYRAQRADGTVGWIEGRGRVIDDDWGRPARVVGICIDVTQRKQAELALKDSDRRKDEFLATLAHELRNPLAPISNAMQFLQLTGLRGPDLRDVTDIIQRQVRQMTRLVDDLLDISRITRNKLELRKDSVDLATVVYSAVETSRPVIETQAHKLTVRLPSEPIPLVADSVRLAQVFSNLLNNAAKFTKSGGDIELTAERQGDEVRVTVRDNGVGIPSNELSHVFEMFTQVSESTHGPLIGLGIGLALAKRLVELHGGSIQASSEGSGRGSEFHVRLPIVERATVDQPSAKPADGRTAFSTRYRILVVDDNKDSVESLGLLLAAMGSDVRKAYDGVDAIEMARAFLPQAVILDIGMPRMNGYEAARAIRKEPWGADMVLVALTGWGQDEDRRRSAEAGFDLHLTKPVDAAALRGLLQQLVGRTSTPA